MKKRKNEVFLKVVLVGLLTTMVYGGLYQELTKNSWNLMAILILLLLAYLTWTLVGEVTGRSTA